MLAMGIAIGIGALHLMTGLITGFYENMKKKKFRKGILAQGVWMLFLGGIIILAVSAGKIVMYFLMWAFRDVKVNVQDYLRGE